MAIQRELSIGEHTVKYSKPPDYADLVATINVGDNAVTCISGPCGVTGPPGVIASGFTVTGYLAEALEVTICNYIDSSGWDGMVWDHVLGLLYKFNGLDAMAENTRLKILEANRPNAFPSNMTENWDWYLGALYYFNNLKTLGNGKTGCNY